MEPCKDCGVRGTEKNPTVNYGSINPRYSHHSLWACIEALQAELAAERERVAGLLEAAQDLYNSDIGAEPELSQPYALRQMATALARYKQKAGG